MATGLILLYKKSIVLAPLRLCTKTADAEAPSLLSFVHENDQEGNSFDII